ncbi:restriction endonuclease [Dolosigranulum pigrum]|uniref:DEAD/DEAH box helicase family protein n=1 Tax=Dolosigranulum pigrum TaxID=29394 RepID=UPI000DC37877|nr:DEAD/DEAH box helicase family protein [Dolosigranulum pigrum]RAN59600.1 restriction endonuclease [Dolosigranulum pigrum]
MASKKNNKLKFPLMEKLSDYSLHLTEDNVMRIPESFHTPQYIYDNMVHKFRGYQDQAFSNYHRLLTDAQFNPAQSKHVLFNMATGSGKTDLMAGLILYLYEEHGFQHFVFTVNTNSVVRKTIDNFTNSSSDKYLFKQPIEIDGRRIRIEKVNQFPFNPQQEVIYIKFGTIQSLSSDISNEKENTMGKSEYKKYKVALLADEAHHYSASTKKEKEDENSWESIINTILTQHNESKLLEFTATVDFNNKNVYKKYKNKIIYRYALDRFVHDGYSKNIRRIQTDNNDRENMINAVLLSEFRRLYALEMYGSQLKPVILFKSQRVDDSNNAEETFNNLIDELTVDHILDFIDQRFSENMREFSETLYRVYRYYLNNKDELYHILNEIKYQFDSNRVLNANDSGRSQMLESGLYTALNTLESPDNLYRVVFAVAKLTEGWDVLNLYDIVRISDVEKDSRTKTYTNAEAQLIGRGARYNPFEIGGNKSYTRRFEEDNSDSLILETLHYHTLNETQYLKNLVKSLNEMNLPTGEDKKNPAIEVTVKKAFKKTNLWKRGHVFYNESHPIEKTYYNTITKYNIPNQNDIRVDWKHNIKEDKYASNNIYSNSANTFDKKIDIDKRIWLKAFSRNTFFYFERLKKIVPMINSIEEFLGENWLNIDQRDIYATVPYAYAQNDLTAEEKLDVVEQYLKDIEKNLRTRFKKARGTNKFIGYPIREYVSDYNKRVPNISDQKVARRDQFNKSEHFVYNGAVMNELETTLVNRVLERVDKLKQKYDEVYLIRVDESMHRESTKNDKLKLYQFQENPKEVHYEAFQPDFLLLLQKEDLFIQIFIEPKGALFVEKDSWKEDLLMHINDHEESIEFEDHISGVKIKGLKFFTKKAFSDANNLNDEYDIYGTMNQLDNITQIENIKDDFQLGE